MATPETLAAFVSATVAFPLHSWQENCLCPILERLRYEKGLRILLHAPPQYGKSVIVSQRLPAYLMGHDRLTRVGLAAYNETHSKNFGAVIRDIMASGEYAQMFPGSVIDKNEGAGEFSTSARAALRDAQASFKAMGLLSGFTGRGVDHLIIDDPYKSVADAESDAVNTAVWRWWSGTARPRVRPETNVIVMFHRYHDDDLAAKLRKEGGWEYYRFPALADGKTDEGIDPTGREVGEPLSPMRTVDDLLREQAADAYTFGGQFQGIPPSEMGEMFKTDQIKIHAAHPSGIIRSCRAWDIAATAGGGDYTAGVLIGVMEDKRCWILDVILLQGSPDEVDEAIIGAAKADGTGVAVRLAEDPGSAGKRDAAALTRKLSGFDVTVERVSGSKENRARPLASQVNLGNVSAVECGRMVTTGPYRRMNVLQALLRMMSGFPKGTAKKDGVDAAADAFTHLTHILGWAQDPAALSALEQFYRGKK